MTETVAIGVIGGSGLYHMPGISERITQRIQTPFGPPSGDIVIGTLRGKRVAFLPRHGVGHVLTPSQVPYRANIYALKTLGVRFIIGVNACGSLREDYEPGHLVIPDQLFDYTTGLRERSFFSAGLVGHISVADPFCSELSDVLYRAVQRAGGIVHKGGTFLIEEGPRFATRAESHIFRQWGCSLIGMTTAPEAFLAREAEIAYATIAHITDYDVWHVSEAPVTVERVIETMRQNIAIVEQAVAHGVEMLNVQAECDCHHALASALISDRSAVSLEAIEHLKPIVGRYFAAES